MALTIRLPEGLHRLAADMAGSLGISLNALVAIALAEFLRKRPITAGQPVPQEPVKAAQTKRGASGGVRVLSRQQRRAMARRDAKLRGK